VSTPAIPLEGNIGSLHLSSFDCQRRQHQLLDHADHRIRAEGRPLASYSNKPIYHPSTSITHKMPSFKCIACLEKFTDAAEFKTHKRECRANRLAYLKIRAIRLDPKGKCSNSPFVSFKVLITLPDKKCQDKIGIRFEYVRDMGNFSDTECILKKNMRSQLRGKRYLTEELVSNLGRSSNDELSERRDMEKRRVMNMENQKDLDSRNTLRKRSLPDPDATHSHKKSRRSDSSPLESLPGPSTRSPTRNQNSANPSNLSNSTSQNTGEPNADNQGVANESNRPLEASEDTDHGSTRFDAAFAAWLEGEKVSKAAIGRLVKDPTLQPLADLMTRDYVESLRTDSADEVKDRDKDEEWVSTISGTPLSDIFS
jgi:hypothetical protein